MSLRDQESDIVFKADGTCPLCGLLWEQNHPNSACSHEAGWYRKWLLEATEMLLLERDLVARRVGDIRPGFHWVGRFGHWLDDHGWSSPEFVSLCYRIGYYGRPNARRGW